MSLSIRLLFVGTILVTLAMASTPAQAGYIVTLTQVGGDVVASGSGAIDLSGLSLASSTVTSVAQIGPSSATVFTGPTSTTSVDEYNGFSSGPTNFGSGSTTVADSGSGDLVGVLNGLDVLVPHGYVSGTGLSDTSTYSSQTFTGLGVTAGNTYEWSWGSGANQNFTLQIGNNNNNTVPDPGTLALLVPGLAGLGFLRRRKRAS